MRDVIETASLTPSHLAEGLRNDELRLVYQPKVNMRTGRVIGAEALLRWSHPELGEVSPGAFLPLAQNSDLIIDIGIWVLRTALRQIVEWQRRELDLTVSVNVAPRQLQHPDFLTVLRRCLDEIPEAHPGRLELEILESAALENTAHVREIIETCREWGVTFALDDFGTGYASLSYLRQIPAEVLKIDQSFIRDLLDDEDDRFLVSGVIGLARAFRRVVVAEGMETPAQGVLLMRLGCDIVQGYGIARPMPPDRMADWVASFEPDPQWQSWMDVPWELDDLPLLVAATDHCDYVDQVIDYIDGGPLNLPRAEFEDHHQCRFGRWYYHQGQARYGDMREFNEIEPMHRRLHDLAGEVIRQHEAGNDVQARAQARALQNCEHEIIGRLQSLQEWVGNRTVHKLDISRRVSVEVSNQLAGVKGLSPVQILIVDDTPANIELLAGALSREYTVKFATSGPRALNMVAQPDKPDLILLDIMMPEMDGYEVCRRLKDDSESRDIPIIFLTAKTDQEDQIRAFKAGGVDFVTRPFQLPIVLARVRLHLNLKLRTDLLEARASLDGLTGVPNRHQLNDVLAAECRRMQRNLMPLALLLVDIDRFKSYNDNYGHGAGDDCLRQIGAILLRVRLRPGDFVARFGGETFAVVLPASAAEDARDIAEQIRSMVELLNIPHAYSPVAHHITVSVGCVSSKPRDYLDTDRLVEEAGQALRAAKQAGRNRVHCVTSTTVDGG